MQMMEFQIVCLKLEHQVGRLAVVEVVVVVLEVGSGLAEVVSFFLDVLHDVVVAEPVVGGRLEEAVLEEVPEEVAQLVVLDSVAVVVHVGVERFALVVVLLHCCEVVVH